MSEAFPGPHTAQGLMSAREGGAHGSLGDDAWTFQWSLPWKQVFPASRKWPAVCLWLSCSLLRKVEAGILSMTLIAGQGWTGTLGRGSCDLEKMEEKYNCFGSS